MPLSTSSHPGSERHSTVLMLGCKPATSHTPVTHPRSKKARNFPFCSMYVHAAGFWNTCCSCLMLACGGSCCQLPLRVRLRPVSRGMTPRQRGLIQKTSSCLPHLYSCYRYCLRAITPHYRLHASLCHSQGKHGVLDIIQMSAVCLVCILPGPSAPGVHVSETIRAQQMHV